MSKIGSKKGVEIVLSKLKGFSEAKVSAEQYITPSSIAAEVIWKACLNGDIEDKVIGDLGCGTGILGIGCLLLGARKVFFVDNDERALQICRKNIEIVESEGFEFGNIEFIESGIDNFKERVDTVVMNPPFGTKKKHADREFLMKAFDIAEMTYSFHKSITDEYIVQLAEGNGLKVSERFDFSFILGNTMAHHVKKKEYIDVSCFVFKR